MSRIFLACAALAALLPLVAAAAQTDAAGPIGPVAGDTLRQGAWSYRATVIRGDQAVTLGERTLSVRPVMERGVPAWLILEETRALGETLTDSVLVARRDLRPLRQAATIGPMRIALRFTGDSVLGRMSAAGGEHAEVALLQEPGMVVNAGMMESILTLLPLREGWSAEVRQLAPSPTGTLVVPLRLEVAGADTVTVPAGTFSAWVLRVGAPGNEQTMWVAREDGRLLRIRMSPPQMSDITYETVYLGPAQPSATPR